MIAAIYARKSTDQNLPDEEKSVTRQVEHATAYAQRRGWTVALDHVYQDDGISGAEFVKRPGFLRLMNALKPRPPFQVLIMSEESRLGREAIETSYALKQLIDAGVRMFTYLDDRERTLGSALDKVMLSLTNFASEMEREKGRQRTQDAMQRKAARGHVAGGKVYGYRNVDREDHVALVIEPAQAAIIQRIFDEIARGRGFARVAQLLNREGIPGPRPGHGWAMTGVRAIVFRDTYRGRLIYGRTRWVDKGGTKIKQDVPEHEWVTVDAPALRIIAEDAWAAAHARLERTRHTYVIGGRLGGRPEAGIESRHLLSGFVLCGVCMGSMHAIRRTSRRGAPRIYYVCNGWRVDGTCRNAWSLPLPDLDAAVVAALREDVLTPDLVDDVAARAVELWGQQHAGLDARRRGLEGELRRVERELGRFTEAIASGEAPPTILEAMRARERRRGDLTAQLEHVDGLERTARPAMTAALRADLRGRLESWDALLRSNPIEARPVLRRLLVGRLTPRQLPAGRFYEFSGTATYGELLAGVVGGLVPPG
jgi:DNA invertase Pin-like site-specific DNA recombinase